MTRALLGRDVYRQVARMHITMIGRGFLSSLGEEFLSLVYQSIDEHPDSAMFVEMEGDRVVGFVSGTIRPRAMYRRLLSRLPAVAWSLRGSLVSPRRVMGMFSVARYMRGGGPGLPHLPVPELLSMAVDPAHRGKGVAERLYRTLEAYFTSHGVRAFKIVAGEALVPAHRFYEKMGARRMARFQMHEGATSIVFVHETCAGEGGADGHGGKSAR